MTETALARLQQQIEAVRREAFADGYAAAMRQVRELASRSADGRATAQPAPAASPSIPEGPPSRRGPRGANARLVEGVLRSIAPRAARPAEIRTLLRREQGAALAFTSIRHALHQLADRQAAEQIAHSRAWRYRSESAR